MMATTHALWGMALALPVAAAAPELTPVALAAGFFGGLAPDLDLYAGHRRTLHFPVYAWVAVAPALVIAAAVQTPVTVALAVGLAAAGLHAASDVAGAGLELRPWRAGSDRAVYSHFHGRWLPARRLVRYDGSPEDLALASVAGVAVLAATGDALGTAGALAVGGVLAVSAVYTLLRKRLAGLAARLAAMTPGAVRPYVPARYLEP